MKTSIKKPKKKEIYQTREQREGEPFNGDSHAWEVGHYEGYNECYDEWKSYQDEMNKEAIKCLKYTKMWLAEGNNDILNKIDKFLNMVSKEKT